MLFFLQVPGKRDVIQMCPIGGLREKDGTYLEETKWNCGTHQVLMSLGLHLIVPSVCLIYIQELVTRTPVKARRVLAFHGFSMLFLQVWRGQWLAIPVLFLGFTTWSAQQRIQETLMTNETPESEGEDGCVEATNSFPQPPCC